MLTEGEYIVRLAHLPEHVKAITCIDEFGFANIYVNDLISEEAKQAAILHELEHIVRDDAFNPLAIQTVEK